MKIFLLLFFLGCTPKIPEVSKICLEGHTYFKYSNQLAIKLTDDGKPIKCGQSQEVLDQELIKISLNWLKLVDEKNYDKTWEEAAPFFKSAVSKKDWAKTGKSVDKQLGNFIKRDPLETTITGDRAEVKFKSDYQNLSGLTETVLFAKVEGKWMVIGYLVK